MVAPSLRGPVLEKAGREEVEEKEEVELFAVDWVGERTPLVAEEASVLIGMVLERPGVAEPFAATGL